MDFNVLIYASSFILCAVILSITIFKCTKVLSSSISKISLNVSVPYRNDNVVVSNNEIKDNRNLYEDKMMSSIYEAQGRAFDNPVHQVDTVREFSSHDDDISDISQQLKGINDGR